ncbi:MAG: AsmA family protein [Desulfotalea sp.]
MKKILGIVAGFLLLSIAGLVVLVTTIDPNQFKDLISEKVKETTNQELIIKGDIGWRFFPSIGFTIGETSLKNPPGFAEENLIKFSEAELSISVMPLLSHHLEVGQLQLNDARFFIQTLKNGTSNLDTLTKSKQEQKDKKETATAEESKKADKTPWTISLAGISLKNASALIIDNKKKTKKEISKLNFELDQFKAGSSSQLAFELISNADGLKIEINGEGEVIVSESNDNIAIKDFEIETILTGKDIPKGKVEILLSSDISYTLSNSTAEISKFTLRQGDSKIAGNAKYVDGKISKIRFQAKSEELDLDKLLSSKSNPKAAKKGKSSSTPKKLSKVEPNLSFLRKFDIEGKLNIGKLKSSNVLTTDIDIKMQVKKGIIKLTNFSANLYKGTIKAKAKINTNRRPHTFTATKNISGIQIRPMLQAAAETGLLAGTTNAQVNVSGTGLSEYRLRRNIRGSIAAQIKDGAIYGVDITDLIKKAEALIKTNSTTKKATEANSEQKTEFSSLDMKFKLGKGLATAQKIAMVSPFIKTNGNGNTNLMTEKLNLSLNVNIGDTYKNRGDLEFLKDKTIPLKLTGTWQNPSYGIAIDELIQGAVKEEIQKTVEKELGGALDKLFN